MSARGTKQSSVLQLIMSAFGGKADIPDSVSNVRNDPKQTNPSTPNPFARAAGPMRADFEMTSGLFQARPVSRLIARVTYHAAAASMPAAYISAVELRRGGAERFHVLYVGVPELRMRDQRGRYREIIA